MKADRVRRLALCALLTAIALTIFVVEAQFPLPVPVPGLKLGLSNIVTLFALAAFGWKEALAILLVRVFLGNLITGQMMSLFYSLAGGLLSFVCMALILRVLKQNQLWVAGVIGGITHNVGQMAVAVAVTDTTALLAYLPVLTLCGILTGALTGLCAQLLYQKLRRFFQ
ncbi:MAG: Gx transporter family protein [Oscillospiraceae bacterium]|nr:Gx transporter family protein [Oscillospiraceae bacterium]